MAISGFECDIYISYARIDDQPLTEGKEGWVSHFHTTLSYMLAMRLGREARIWRDVKLSGSDSIDDEIAQDLSKTSLFLAVVSPRYIQSEWCLREVKEFCNAAENTGGIVIGNRSRAFKVIKTPVDDESALPDATKNALGYPFYIVEQERAIELDPAFSDDFKQEYLHKMADLTYDMADVLSKLRDQKPAV